MGHGLSYDSVTEEKHMVSATALEDDHSLHTSSFS